MKNYTLVVIFSGIIALAGCGGGGSSSTQASTPASQQTPAMSVTIDRLADYDEGALIEIESSVANGSGEITYAWSQTSGETVNFESAQANLVFTAPNVIEDSVLNFTLNVSDASGQQANASLTVNVINTSLSLPLNSGYVSALAGHEDDIKPIIREITSSLDGSIITQIIFSSTRGDFVISCRNNQPSYYISTEEVTNNGNISYRIGPDETVIEEQWFEDDSSYRLLIPRSYDESLIVSLYQNWEGVFQYDVFAGGLANININMSGFPAAIDQTREACNWSETRFPSDNGWGKSMPVEPPADARYAEFTSDFKPFRTLAWRDQNATGKTKLLVKVGDFEGEGDCDGAFTITNNFYVKQNGKIYSAVVGSYARARCRQPEMFVLQGNFDAAKALTLEVYPFHTNSLNREASELAAPDGPIAILDFEDK